MKTTKIILLFTIIFAVFVASISIGSANISPFDIARAFLYTIFGVGQPDDTHIAILLNLRLPRALLAFIVGASLSVSGAIMQSVLRNPLASSFTLGVSSGASLGAALIIMLPTFFAFTLPLAGFVFGMLTIIFVIAISARIDGKNYTIILVGMIMSLFVNAATSLLVSLNREHASRLIFWQMGSFSMQGWSTVILLAAITLVGILLTMRYHRELDIMTFGEEQAQLLGVNLRSVKWVLLIISAAITGSAIAFVGIIGFVDLVAPHIVRRIFGARHKLIIPLSACFGGAFMMLCDLIARSVLDARELPVGVVSALVGAPFFAYVYFRKGGRDAKTA